MRTLNSIVNNNPDEKWNYSGLSFNPNVTIEYIMENKDKPWNWFYVSGNANLTPDFIENNLDLKWEWFECISENEMNLGKKKWIDQKRLEIIKAFQIQRHWRNCISNPNYKLAKKFLNKVYDS